MQAKKNNERASNGGQQDAILAKKSADCAGGCAKRNKDRGKSGDERQRRGEESRFRGVAFAQLLHADAREHGDIAGNEREHAGGQKR